ncbi:hypothetical protein [Deefgea sp. CFH1-16]|uniref:hypothetical protein n=1 Tax=Deefgea sp. CFH1-16 TaxID=2675457 RepID=UPI0015F66286|nr:hypothetical protein [Deefgea sp. CFH1-16]MBM5574508.1 hypothetical protein [Deefgea sp. CFH1-16]
MWRLRLTVLAYVEIVFGRRLWLPGIKSSNDAKCPEISGPIQDTIADLIELVRIAVVGTRRINIKIT